MIFVRWIQRIVDWFRCIQRDLDDCAQAGRGDEFWPPEDRNG